MFAVGDRRCYVGRVTVTTVVDRLVGGSCIRADSADAGGWLIGPSVAVVAAICATTDVAASTHASRVQSLSFGVGLQGGVDLRPQVLFARFGAVRRN